MAWLSDIFSGDDSPEGRAAREDPRERARQLRRGIARAAASLERHERELARAADEAAGELLGRLPDDDGEMAREAAGRLDRLHFALLQVDVAGASPDQAEAGQALEAVRELGEEAPGGGRSGDGAPDGEARGAAASG